MLHTKSLYRRLQLHIPDAESVSAVGEFNNWSTASTPLENIGDNMWELLLLRRIDPFSLSFFVISRGSVGGHIVRLAMENLN